MESIPDNPYSDKKGNPLPDKLIKWVEWEDENRTNIKRIWALPIEERRYKAVCDENFQCRMDAESGTYYDDNQRQLHIRDYLIDYRAIESEMNRTVRNPYGDENDGPQVGKHWDWIDWERQMYRQSAKPE